MWPSLHTLIAGGTMPAGTGNLEAGIVQVAPVMMIRAELIAESNLPQ